MSFEHYTDAQYKKLEFRVWSMFQFGWYLVKENFVPLAIISIIMVIPGNLIANIIVGNLHLVESTHRAKDIESIYGICALLSGMVAQLGGMFILRNFLSGISVTVGDALVYGLKNWHIFILTSLLYILIVMGGVILLVIPGIIAGVWFGFYGCSIVFEEKKYFNALEYSKSLVEGQWWRAFWMSFLFGIITCLLLVIPAAIVSGIAGLFLGGSHNLSLDILLDTITAVASIPSLFVMVGLFLGFQKFPPEKSNAATDMVA